MNILTPLAAGFAVGVARSERGRLARHVLLGRPLVYRVTIPTDETGVGIRVDAPHTVISHTSIVGVRVGATA